MSSSLWRFPTITALTSSKLAKLQHAKSTSKFNRIILTQWGIVNAKIPHRGQLLRACQKSAFPSGRLPKEYNKSLAPFFGSCKAWFRSPDLWNTQCLLPHFPCTYACYYIEELGVLNVLLGKFQTNCRKDTCGKYWQLLGAQYHMPIR